MPKVIHPALDAIECASARATRGAKRIREASRATLHSRAAALPRVSSAFAVVATDLAIRARDDLELSILQLDSTISELTGIILSEGDR